VVKRSRKHDSQRTIDEAKEREFLTALEDEWLSARLRRDLEATARVVDDSYEGSTSDGVVQTKEDFLRAVESAHAFDEGSHSDRRVRVDGHIAVSTGTAQVQSAGRRHVFRYLRVYRRSDGEWRLIASQSTRLRSA
jgi:hypothetical protein